MWVIKKRLNLSLPRSSVPRSLLVKLYFTFQYISDNDQQKNREARDEAKRRRGNFRQKEIEKQRAELICVVLQTSSYHTQTSTDTKRDNQASEIVAIASRVPSEGEENINRGS